MKTLSKLTKDERSLLLFLETAATDYGGRLCPEHMNVEDMAIAKQWAGEGFIDFGRVKFDDIKSKRTHWVRLSGDAWDIAHAERRARSNRIWGKKTWRTTEE